jgi:hypothetical protein
VSFEPRLPAYVSAGFQRRELTYARPDFPSGTEGSYDMLYATYLSSSGGRLSVIQGWYDVAPLGWYGAAPDGMKGSLPLGGGEAYWVKGGPKPVSGLDADGRPIIPGWDDGGYILFWSAGIIDCVAWERSPDGELSTGLGPELSYAVVSDSLPLEELVRVAESMVSD